VNKILLFIVLASFNTWAQEKKTKFGFYAEVIRSVNSLETNNKYFATVESKNTFGFGFGAKMFLYESDLTSFRFGAGFGYLNQIVVLENPGTSEAQRGSIFLKLPGHAIFSLKKNSNVRLVAGITPSYGFLGGDDQNGQLEFKKADLTGDIGLGYRIQATTFSIMPELKYSYSFIDALDETSSPYTESISEYLRNKLLLTLVFTR
jgi:hypothetical protein